MTFSVNKTKPCCFSFLSHSNRRLNYWIFTVWAEGRCEHTGRTLTHWGILRSCYKMSTRETLAMHEKLEWRFHDYNWPGEGRPEMQYVFLYSISDNSRALLSEASLPSDCHESFTALSAVYMYVYMSTYIHS